MFQNRAKEKIPIQFCLLCCEFRPAARIFCQVTNKCDLLFQYLFMVHLLTFFAFVVHRVPVFVSVLGACGVYFNNSVALITGSVRIKTRF